MRTFFLRARRGSAKRSEAYCIVENTFYEINQPALCSSISEVTHQGIIATFHHVQVVMT